MGKHENVNLTTPAIKNHKTNSLETPAMKSTQTAVNSKRTADLEQTIRQVPQQASLNRLRYSPAGEIDHIINK